MEATSAREVHMALAERLAKREISNDVLGRIAERLVVDGLKIGGVDFCPYGICIDYFSEKPISLDAITAKGKYRALRHFPWGIIDPDIFRVQVEMRVPEFDQSSPGL